MPVQKKNKRVSEAKTMWVMLFDIIPLLRIKHTAYINKSSNLVFDKSYWLFGIIPLFSASREYAENQNPRDNH